LPKGKRVRGKEDLAMVKDGDFDKLSAWLGEFRFRGRNLFLHQEVFSINLTLSRMKKGKGLEVNFINNPGRSQLFIYVANRFSESNQPAAIPNFLRTYIRKNFKFIEIRSPNGAKFKMEEFLSELEKQILHLRKKSFLPLPELSIQNQNKSKQGKSNNSSGANPGDVAMRARHTGGIDLTPANMNLQAQNSSGEIKFHLDPSQLQQLQNASGFVPVIISVRPLGDLRSFLGIVNQT